MGFFGGERTGIHAWAILSARSIRVLLTRGMLISGEFKTSQIRAHSFLIFGRVAGQLIVKGGDDRNQPAFYCAKFANKNDR